MRTRSRLHLLQIKQSAIYLNGTSPTAPSHVAGQCDCADPSQSSHLLPLQKQSLAKKFQFAPILAKSEQNQPTRAWETGRISKKKHREKTVRYEASQRIRRRTQKTATPPPQNPEQKTNPRRTKVEEKGPHYHTHPNMADTGVHQPTGAAPASAGRGMRGAAGRGSLAGPRRATPSLRRNNAAPGRPPVFLTFLPPSLLSPAQPQPSPPGHRSPWPRSRRHKAAMGHDIPDRRGSPLLPAGPSAHRPPWRRPSPPLPHTPPHTATRATHTFEVFYATRKRWMKFLSPLTGGMGC